MESYAWCAGLFVSLSTFLFIKSTGPLTYNIVGHLKTISILTTGYLFFHEDMNTKKVGGVALQNVGRLAPAINVTAHRIAVGYWHRVGHGGSYLVLADQAITDECCGRGRKRQGD